MSRTEVKDYQHYELLRKNSMLLLYFFHPMCTACVDAAPALAGVMEENDWLPWSKVLLEQHADVAAQNMVFIVPTLIIVQGERELYRQSRFINIEELSRTLESLREIQLQKIND